MYPPADERTKSRPITSSSPTSGTARCSPRGRSGGVRARGFSPDELSEEVHQRAQERSPRAGDHLRHHHDARLVPEPRLEQRALVVGDELAKQLENAPHPPLGAVGRLEQLRDVVQRPA